MAYNTRVSWPHDLGYKRVRDSFWWQIILALPIFLLKRCFVTHIWIQFFSWHVLISANWKNRKPVTHLGCRYLFRFRSHSAMSFLKLSSWTTGLRKHPIAMFLCIRPESEYVVTSINLCMLHRTLGLSHDAYKGHRTWRRGYHKWVTDRLACHMNYPEFVLFLEFVFSGRVFWSLFYLTFLGSFKPKRIFRGLPYRKLTFLRRNECLERHSCPSHGVLYFDVWFPILIKSRLSDSCISLLNASLSCRPRV